MIHKYSILVIAPHLEYPQMKGADILIDNRINSFINYFENVTIIGNDFVHVYRNTDVVSKKKFKNKNRSKSLAGIRTIYSNKSYLFNKFITPNYIRRIKQNDISSKNFDIVYYSFIYTADKFSSYFPDAKSHIIETHNNDIEWYKHLYNNSNNYLSRLVAKKSIDYTYRFLNSNNSYYYIALTPNDRKGYLNYVIAEKIFLVSVGITVPSKKRHELIKKYSGLTLLFVGSLDVKMNYDALNYFKNIFYAILKKRVNSLKIRVAGRNPSRDIKKLCNEQKWQLFENVTNRKLSDLLWGADYMIMPFAYTTGAKMKLFESFAYNLPILGTSPIGEQFNQKKYSNYNFGNFSNSPEEWINYILNGRNNKNLSNNLREIAEDFSWERVNSILIEKIVDSVI